MSPLQQLLLDRMAELDLSFREAAQRSKGRVSATTLNLIATGKRTQVTDQTLEGVAIALDLAVSKVRKAAGETASTPTEFRLPRKADRLSPAKRRAVLAMVNALLEDEKIHTQ